MLPIRSCARCFFFTEISRLGRLRKCRLDFQSNDCKPILLGVRSGKPHPFQLLCQSFREVGPISEIAGSQ